MSFTVVPEEPARQLADPGPPEACPHCGRRAFWRNGSDARHRLLLGPCRVQRWRCQSCGRTHSRPPEGVTRQPRTRSWQATLMRLYVLGVSLRATAASLELLGCFVSPASLWRDVQRRQAEAPWDTTAQLPGVVLLDETWLSLEGRKQPVAVVLDREGRPRDLRRTGPDFDGTAYFRELEARGVHTLVTDDEPAFRKALQGCGRDRQLCVVHMRRTVRRRRQRMRQGKDKILPAPEDAAVLRGGCGWCGNGPCGAAHCCWSAASGPTRACSGCHRPCWLWWNMSWTAGTTSYAACATPPSPPVRTGRGLVGPLQAPGTAGPRSEDAAGRTGLPASAGRKPGLKPAGPPGPERRSRSCPTKLFSTKVKQCRRMGIPGIIPSDPTTPGPGSRLSMPARNLCL